MIVVQAMDRPRSAVMAAQMASQASTRTTQLYDRRREEVSLDDEAERLQSIVVAPLP